MMSSQRFTYKQYSRTEELPANSPENAGPETQHRLNIITKSFHSYKKKFKKIFCTNSKPLFLFDIQKTLKILIYNYTSCNIN